jgi:biopolymer transport protein ExbD
MKGGIIVRLIDVCFITLFGFIVASDVIHKAQIKLPPQLSASMGQGKVREPRPLVLRIQVRPKQMLTQGLLRQIETNLRPVGKKAQSEANQSKMTQLEYSEQFVSYVVRTGTRDEDIEEELKTVQELENYVRRQRAERLEPGQKLIIAIVPDGEAMLQGIVNIFEICRRYRLEYHFRYLDSGRRLQELL